MYVSKRETDFLNRAKQLALQGLGHTYPNPVVGAVIVYNDTIIGEGFHWKAGEPHAEIIAIDSVSNKELLKQSILYVCLEPCNHSGKTPPCTHAILEYGIPEVIIDEVDLNPRVNHSGIDFLRNNGVRVKARSEHPNIYNSINKRFFTYHQKKRPYIVLKWAQSKNGFIDANLQQPVSISGDYSKQLNHKWRTEEAAILIGKNTFLKDNPKLNIRYWVGEDLMKFVINKNLEGNKKFNLYQDDRTFFLNELKSGNQYIQLDFEEDTIPQMMQTMYDMEVQSLIVEGGAVTIQSFLDADLWDEARIITNLKLEIETGVKAPFLNKGNLISTENVEEDRIEIFQNEG